MKPSSILESKRVQIRDVAAHYRVANLRIFGSVLEGHDHEGSDIDILVDALPGTTLFELGSFQVELQSLLGVPVDVLTPGDLPLKFREQVLKEAIPV
jgi:predicted nucleotidyltransferase